MRRIAAPLATLLLAVALGACADGDGGPRDPGSPTPPASSPGSPSPDPGSPSPRPSDTPHLPMPTASPPPGQPVLTLTGRVYAGVETGCQLLEYGGTEYLLVWQGGRLPTDRTVTVRGYPDPGVNTICMQGTPFVVLEVVSD